LAHPSEWPKIKDKVIKIYLLHFININVFTRQEEKQSDHDGNLEAGDIRERNILPDN